MDSVGKLPRCGQPFHLSLVPRPLPFPNSLSFRTSSPPLKLKCRSIRATATDSYNSEPRKPLLQTLKPVLKTACVTLSAAAALLLFRLQPRPAVAEPVNVSAVEPAEQSTETNVREEDKAISENVRKYPANVESLRSLMEEKIKSRKLQEAIEIIEQLIELEPEENDWPLLKGNLYSYSGDFDLAKKAFEDILEKEPDLVEAYHGLVMANSETGKELNSLKERIEVAMERCRKDGKSSDVRDFKLLIAQVMVIEENYGEALKVYEELVKEEPRDFRPYMCQGIVYTLLRKKDEAEENFRQYRNLIPDNHPYTELFDDNFITTKFFAQNSEREMAGSKG